jgi:alanine dehydrogenase
MRPVGAELLSRDGHTVLVQTGAGVGSGFSDDQYRAAGSADRRSAADGVGEGRTSSSRSRNRSLRNCPSFARGSSFSRTSISPRQGAHDRCLDRKCVSIAYETLTDDRGGLPLLTPMSEVAGKLSVQEGAKYLERPFGGKGVLLGGVPGVPPGPRA